ncbi:MAG: nucleotidyltransferase family protein [Bacteroidales bacterium]|nr:nucleotidyltransferase family protein [Bacteroidales bacterium]
MNKNYIIETKTTILQALSALNDIGHAAQTLFVVDDENKMVGTLTDGDIRRSLISGKPIGTPVGYVMHTDFQFMREFDWDVRKLKTLRKKGILFIPILDAQQHIVGVFNLMKYKNILPIDAVLMAGGKGERLRPLTEHTPKPLLPVGDKAIIDYNIDNLTYYGVKNISVTVNYLKEQLEEHFTTERNGVKVQCVPEPRFLGTIGSLRFVEKFENDTILVMNSDLFTNIDLEDFYLQFIETGADMSAAAVPYSISVPYGIFNVNEDKITGLSEKPTYNYYANAGIYLIKKEMLDLIPEDTFFNATDLIELLISQNKKVVRFPIHGYWIDIGNKDEYAKAQDIVKHL